MVLCAGAACLFQGNGVRAGSNDSTWWFARLRPKYSTPLRLPLSLCNPGGCWLNQGSTAVIIKNQISDFAQGKVGAEQIYNKQWGVRLGINCSVSSISLKILAFNSRLRMSKKYNGCLSTPQSQKKFCFPSYPITQQRASHNCLK